MEPKQIQGEPALQVQQGAEQDQQKGEGGGAASGKDANPAPGQKQPPGSPQGKQEAGSIQPGQFARQGGDDPEADVVYQCVSVGKDDGPRRGNEFLKTGVPDDVVRMLVDPASPSGEDHHDGESRQYAQGLPCKKRERLLLRRAASCPLPDSPDEQRRHGEGDVPMHPSSHERQHGQQQPGTGVPFQQNRVEGSFRTGIIHGRREHVLTDLNGGGAERQGRNLRIFHCREWDGSGGRNGVAPSSLYRKKAAFHAGGLMNKTEFIQELRRELGGEATSREAEQMLDAVLNTIVRSVQRKSQVKFRGFGTFGIKRRQARVVRHPGHGGKLFVHESSTMKFRPSGHLWRK